MEIIQTRKPLIGDRKAGDSFEEDGGRTKYVHFVLNQRTISLGKSWPECGRRDDGWCELGTFLQVLGRKVEESRFEEACFGEYERGDWGDVRDGVPVDVGM